MEIKCFQTRNEADNFLVAVEMILERSGYIAASDIYEPLGIECTDHDRVTGWTSMDGFYTGIDYVDQKPYIRMPDPEDIPFPKNEPKSSNDMVNHPSHYMSETGLEAIDVIEAFTFDLKGIEAVCTGNALKYLCRWKSKNGVEDLKKAEWYLNRLIKHVEKLEKENECHE
jgi:hypothetical protein